MLAFANTCGRLVLEMAETDTNDEVPVSQPRHVARMVEELREREVREQASMSWPTRLANRVAALSGSMPFVVLHVAWFAAWIALNLPFSPVRWDGFPYGLLTMVVSLEAIFLSLFVLMSENRQAARADRDAKVDLEVNLIAEREITKVLALLSEVHAHLGLTKDEDGESAEMREVTSVDDLAEAAEMLVGADHGGER